eukprot:TRINITY_DN32501_c0_g1_i1.p1 TRINITY_DN32501_c0_g1~~TRINITY_DN32501_c0_g1_i1.p1  ORF type:complete len:155 (-),score=27.40 TRINITY_DN32501_c0_g1_i1:37-501(-)
MLRSLVGSEMCIRDRYDIQVGAGVNCGAEVLSCAWDPVDVSRVAVTTVAGVILIDIKKGTSTEVCRVPGHGAAGVVSPHGTGQIKTVTFSPGQSNTMLTGCLLYTSDAADEEDSVDLGCRRIIKKKNSTLPGLFSYWQAASCSHLTRQRKIIDT